MILGDRCTRYCRFCAVQHGAPQPVDPEEPERVARVAANLNLDHVVITSVTRDDLPDGGAGHFVETIRALRDLIPGITVEVLTPDFQGSIDALKHVINEKPEVFNHNIETVPRLYPSVRPQAKYVRSLKVLQNAHALGDESLILKSGLMLGLGETREEVVSVMRDLRSVNCAVITLGQYLSAGES